MTNISYRRILYLLTAGVLLLALAAGCTRRELELRPDDGYIKIVPDWKNYDPQVTGYYFYNDSGESFYLQGDENGYEGKVKAGIYYILLVTTEMTGAQFDPRGAYDADHIIAGAAPVRADVPEFIGSCVNVFTAGIPAVVVPRSTVPVVVGTQPKNMVRRVGFVVDPQQVTNIQDVELVVNGIVYAVKVCDGSLSDETCKIRSDLSSNNEGKYETDLSIFGIKGKSEVTVNVEYNDGRTESTISKDVTAELNDIPEDGEVVVLLDLDLPAGEKIGLKITVYPWDESGHGSGIVD